MSLDLQVEEMADADLVPVEYRWDADTDILCARLRPTGVAEGLSGSLDVEGRDGAWLTFELRAGRLAAIEVAVWPDVRTVKSLAVPAASGTARVRVPARSLGEEAVEVDTAIQAVADEAERTIHFRIGPQRPIRVLRVAQDLLVEVDARSRLGGLWLLNVPPFPASQ
ncbi:MAG: hypothetical protein ACKVS7_02280 [Gemmatimonadaceae bacterium]